MCDQRLKFVKHDAKLGAKTGHLFHVRWRRVAGAVRRHVDRFIPNGNGAIIWDLKQIDAAQECALA
jgi:hypothetical protein